jgi:hypothetical protein
METKVGRDEAADGLREISRRQQQVIETVLVPDWYWWTVGALVVALGAVVDTRQRGLIIAGVLAFVVCCVPLSLFVAIAARRAQVYSGLLGERGPVVIVFFDALVIGAGLAVAFALQAAGVSHPALLGTLVSALTMVVGGPLVMRALRRIMLANRSGSRA